MRNVKNEELNEIENSERQDIEEIREETEEVKRIVPWKRQITIRGLVASLAIGIIFSVISMKLNLTTGLVPNLNVPAALFAFVFIKTWTKLLEKAGIVSTPFTQQENTIIQTCAVACYSTSFGGGFASYMLGLSKKTYEQAGVDTEGNTPGSYKEPGIGWMTGFLFVTCFVGLLALVPLRKIMIVDYKLAYPSGTATGVLINGFHTAKGDKMAKKQVHGFMRFFSFSFLWAFFQWFFAGGEQCGFSQFPTFGLKAWKNSFYFNFSMSSSSPLLLRLHSSSQTVKAQNVRTARASTAPSASKTTTRNRRELRRRKLFELEDASASQSRLSRPQRLPS